MSNEEKRFSAWLEVRLDFTTKKEAVEIINELLDRFQTIDTKDLNLIWEDADWSLEETCVSCGVQDPMGEDAWHTNACEIVKN